MAEGRVSRQGVGPVQGWGPVQLRDGNPGGAWIQRGSRGGDPTMHVSSAGLWPGAAQGPESPAEWCSGSAGLRGGDLAVQLFFY
jgi:hypothetical protein